MMTKKMEIHFAPSVEWRIELKKGAPSDVDCRRWTRAFRAILRISTVLFVSVTIGAFPKVGPEYKAPTNNVPETYKAAELGQWKEGKPADGITKGRWWEVFNDTTLNALEDRASAANQDLQAAFARVDQARATARMSRADLLPSLAANPSFRRDRYSPNQEPSFGTITVNTIHVPLDLSYEIDLWGRVRRGLEASRASAQASLAAFHNVLLT